MLLAWYIRVFLVYTCRKIFACNLSFVPVKCVGLKAVVHGTKRKKLDSIHPSSVVSLRPDLIWQRRHLSVLLKNIIDRVVGTCVPLSFWGANTNLIRNWGKTTKSIREPWKGDFLFSWLIQASPLEMKLPIFHSKFPQASFPQWHFSRTQASWAVLSQLSQERRSYRKQVPPEEKPATFQHCRSKSLQFGKVGLSERIWPTSKKKQNSCKLQY